MQGTTFVTITRITKQRTLQIRTDLKNGCAEISMLLDVVAEWEGCMLFERVEDGDHDAGRVETNQSVV